MVNAWISHLKEFWGKNKGKMTYKQAMQEAKKTYKPIGSKAKSKPNSKSSVSDKKDKQLQDKLERDFIIQQGLKDREREKKLVDLGISKDKQKELKLIKELESQVKKGGGLFKMASDGKGITLGIKPTVIPKTEQDARNAKTKARLLEEKKKTYAQEGLVYKGGSLTGGDLSANRAKIVRKYQDYKKSVQEGLRKGVLNQKDFNHFMSMAKSLSKGSKTNKYAKDYKKIEKEFKSKKYAKLLASKKEKNPLSKIAEKNLATLARLMEGDIKHKVGQESRSNRERVLSGRKIEYVQDAINKGVTKAKAENDWAKLAVSQEKALREQELQIKTLTNSNMALPSLITTQKKAPTGIKGYPKSIQKFYSVDGELKKLGINFQKKILNFIAQVKRDGIVNTTSVLFFKKGKASQPYEELLGGKSNPRKLLMNGGSNADSNILNLLPINGDFTDNKNILEDLLGIVDDLDNIAASRVAANLPAPPPPTPPPLATTPPFPPLNPLPTGRSGTPPPAPKPPAPKPQIPLGIGAIPPSGNPMPTLPKAPFIPNPSGTPAGSNVPGYFGSIFNNPFASVPPSAPILTPSIINAIPSASAGLAPKSGVIRSIGTTNLKSVEGVIQKLRVNGLTYQEVFDVNLASNLGGNSPSDLVNLRDKVALLKNIEGDSGIDEASKRSAKYLYNTLYHNLSAEGANHVDERVEEEKQALKTSLVDSDLTADNIDPSDKDTIATNLTVPHPKDIGATEQEQNDVKQSSAGMPDKKSYSRLIRLYFMLSVINKLVGDSRFNSSVPLKATLNLDAQSKQYLVSLYDYAADLLKQTLHLNYKARSAPPSEFEERTNDLLELGKILIEKTAQEGNKVGGKFLHQELGILKPFARATKEVNENVKIVLQSFKDKGNEIGLQFAESVLKDVPSTTIVSINPIKTLSQVLKELSELLNPNSNPMKPIIDSFYDKALKYVPESQMVGAGFNGDDEDNKHKEFSESTDKNDNDTSFDFKKTSALIPFHHSMKDNNAKEIHGLQMRIMDLQNKPIGEYRSSKHQIFNELKKLGGKVLSRGEEKDYMRLSESAKYINSKKEGNNRKSIRGGSFLSGVTTPLRDADYHKVLSKTGLHVNVI
jgi:hypothetical protein